MINQTAGWNSSIHLIARRAGSLHRPRALRIVIGRLKTSHRHLHLRRRRIQGRDGRNHPHFQRWLKNPAVRDLVCQNYASPEERERRLCEIFGRPPKPPEPTDETAPDSDGSNPVKPSQIKSSAIQPAKPQP
jgi:hypothetical protein